MDDLIRRGELEMVLLRETAWYDNEDEDVAYEAVRKAPTIDAVEVVRCAECDEFDDGTCKLLRLRREDNDFCSYGARMDAVALSKMETTTEGEKDE